jgi:hypothetical protein
MSETNPPSNNASSGQGLPPGAPPPGANAAPEGGGSPGRRRTSVGCHPSTLIAQNISRKNHRYAHRLLIALSLALVVIALGSAYLHVCSSQVGERVGAKLLGTNFLGVLQRLQLDPTNSVQLDNAGRVTSMSVMDLRWCVGQDNAATIIAALQERSSRINDLSGRTIDRALLEFNVRFNSGVLSTNARARFEQLNKFIRAGDFSEGAATFTMIVQGWTDETRKLVGEKAIFELAFGLEELAQLKREQEAVLLAIRPPRMHLVFWSSPQGALVEAVIWSVIGTLVNLLLNISSAHARGEFRRDESWVIASKLIYGPVLSFALILTIYFGVLNAGTEVRFWLLPLLAFVFGYNTRKVAIAIDNWSERVFQVISKSIENEAAAWEANAAKHAAAAALQADRPKTLSEMIENSSQVVDIAVTAATIKQQNET